MSGPALSLTQRIALNLRLSQALIVTAGKGADKQERRVGLKRHADGKCSCVRMPGEKTRIDYHGKGEHPEDFVTGCPARFFDPALQAAVYQAIEIEDLGGLPDYVGRPLAMLPARLVEFYGEALAARDRLIAERDAAQAALYAR